MKKGLVALALVAAFLLLVGAFGVSAYNGLVDGDQQARSRWAQVENVYQRRMDLVPNLVQTVKAAANFERDTLVAVVRARSQVESSSAARAPLAANEPEAVQKFQQAQDQLSSALSRLLVVAERYPELGATQNFRDLQAQLEGTENRIAVERARYNEAARSYNAARQRFPTSLLVKFMGARFPEKGYFTAAPGAEHAPAAKF